MNPMKKHGDTENTEEFTRETPCSLCLRGDFFP